MEVIIMKYKEVASYLRNKIIEGDWFYGMKLPSQRTLANQFNVNRVTIIKSIELLESEGFIYTKRGSGTYVNDYLSEDFIKHKWLEMMQWTSSTRSRYTVQIINKLETSDAYIHISKGELGKALIPQAKLKKAMNRVSQYIEYLSFGYNNGYGYNKLRELIAKRLNVEGFNISKENVLITSGALHAIQLLSIGFLSKNTIIFSNTPSYIDSTHAFNIGNMRKVKISLETFKDFKQIINQYPSSNEKAIYIEPTFNNPTGHVRSEQYREDILKYSEKHNIPLIEDDIYKDLWFQNKPPKPIKTLDKKSNVLHISSFSKSVAPAIRIGWIVASEQVVEQLADIRMQIDYGSSILSQMVVYELLKSGDYDHHVDNLRNALERKRNDMLEILEEHFSEVATWNIPEGGFFIWLKVQKEVNIKKLFSELLNKEKILFNPGFIYGSDENAIRLSYAYESTENMRYALKILLKYIKKEIDAFS